MKENKTTNCNGYEAMFTFLSEEDFQKHLETCEECAAEHAKMQRVSELIQEVKPYIKEKKKQCVWQDLKGFTSNTKWKRVREVDNSPAYFDEMCYFYEYTHQILFDKHENTHV